MKKVTYNAHPKLIQKAFQEKVKQTKEKRTGNQDSADCFKRVLDIYSRAIQIGKNNWDSET